MAMSRGPDERSHSSAPGSPEAIDPKEFMPGSVFMVPNEIFDIPTVGDHPGLCMHYQCGVGKSTFLRGSGSPPWSWKTTYPVEPTPGNGLRKRTRFELFPIRIQWRWLRSLAPRRRMGRLDSGVFQAIQRELERLFPETPMT